ncbi:hypothetical protein Y032_0002g611 [Ancylostoma ceylanicum]|uniref:Uncharacterized protein n=1 Tax=Ancylostoma ceylanicum TaxID=53326 RepID=A0A016W2C0_9BILA|nr:hypothetical protein Y032_0002g611 [Ancylostoma ceylanicum]
MWAIAVCRGRDDPLLDIAVAGSTALSHPAANACDDESEVECTERGSSIGSMLDDGKQYYRSEVGSSTSRWRIPGESHTVANALVARDKDSDGVAQ